MRDDADAFLALPGGIGTFEEFFEAWTWRQLEFHHKPLGLLDAGGYYQALLEFLRQSVRHGFMSDWQMDLVRVGTGVAELLQSLAEAASMAPRQTSLSQI